MASAKMTTIRFTPEDTFILGAVQQREGLMSRAEALRHVLRYYARAEGIEVSKPKPKRRK